LAAGEERTLVHRALDTLSTANREILWMKEIQGLEVQTISELLAVPVGTVKSRAHRARIELARAVLALDPSYGG
jgi:RNA polymerase sigma-70 factor (ECF subfamily)